MLQFTSGLTLTRPPRSPGNVVALSSYAVDTRISLQQKVNAKLLILVGRTGIEPVTEGL